MWLIAAFDLPVKTKPARKAYAAFRKGLLQDGFSMLQYSLYARFCASEEASKAHRRRVQAQLPEKGHVRLLTVTDHQFGRMEVYNGKSRKKGEHPPEQLLLF